MNLAEHLRLAWEALLANRLRSALTMLGIIIGVGSVIAVIAIGRGTRSAVLAEFSSFSANSFQLMAIPPGGNSPRQRFEPFTDGDVRLLRSSLADVQEVLVMAGMRAEVRFGARTQWADVSGVPAAFARVVRLHLESGRFITPEEDAGGARVLVVGPDAARELFGDVAPLGQVVRVDGYPFRVIGVFARDAGLLARAFGSGTDRAWVAPVTTVRRLTGAREFGQVLVDMKPGTNVAAAMEEAKAILRRRHPEGQYAAFSIQQVTDTIGKVGAVLTGVIGAIAGISLLVGGVGIMNIMLVSVTERTREIGIRKAIGATRTDILLQFLIEAVAVSLAGGMVGTALAALPVWLVGRWLKIPLLVSWDAVALALGFSVGVGVLFGVYPASKAAGRDPIEALRYE